MKPKQNNENKTTKNKINYKNKLRIYHSEKRTFSLY